MCQLRRRWLSARLLRIRQLSKRNGQWADKCDNVGPFGYFLGGIPIGAKTIGFADALKRLESRHPKLFRLLREFLVFYMFSLAVTAIQYLIFTFMPQFLGLGLAGTEFMFPRLPLRLFGMEYSWNILGYEIARNAAGEVIIGGGLGYFISYEFGSLVAQIVNFPLQRNITFKSRGNIAYQIFWYFIAWTLISLICNAVNGLWLPPAQARFSASIYNLLVTFVTGGVSMFIYFFVYKIIFPSAILKGAPEN
jgi:putative flippase GtrA